MKRFLSLTRTGLSPEEKKKGNPEMDNENPSVVVEAVEGDVAEAVGATVSENVISVEMSDLQLTSGRRASVRSGGSAASRRPDLDRCYTFNNTKQDGPWRDKLTVDIFKIGDLDFKGTIKLSEAREAIYKKALGLKRKNLHAVEIEFRGHPVITYRLKELLNIDVEFRSDTFLIPKGGC